MGFRIGEVDLHSRRPFGHSDGLGLPLDVQHQHHRVELVGPQLLHPPDTPRTHEVDQRSELLTGLRKPVARLAVDKVALHQAGSL